MTASAADFAAEVDELHQRYRILGAQFEELQDHPEYQQMRARAARSLARADALLNLLEQLEALVADMRGDLA